MIAATFLVLVGLFVGGSITIYSLVWVAGVATFLAPQASGLGRRRWFAWSCALGSLGACLLSLLVAKYRLAGEAADFALVPAFALLIFVLAHHWAGGDDDVASAAGRVFKKLAAFSYTLYVIHLPILVFVRAWAENAHIGLLQPSAIHVVAALVLAGVIVAIAYLVSQVTERNTDKVRRWVASHLPQSDSRPLASGGSGH